MEKQREVPVGNYREVVEEETNYLVVRIDDDDKDKLKTMEKIKEMIAKSDKILMFMDSNSNIIELKEFKNK